MKTLKNSLFGSMILFLFVAFTAFGNNPSECSSKSNLLDNYQFKGAIGEIGSDEVLWDEVLTFKNGRMHSDACEPYGFKNLSYTAKKDGETIQFSAECTSNSEGQLYWTGTIKNGILEASYKWVKNGETTTYWVKGAMVK